jgi:hypothetical protein
MTGWLLLTVLGLFLYGCTATTAEPTPSPPSLPSLEPVQPSRTPIGADPRTAGGPTAERPTFTPAPVEAPTLTPTSTPHPELRLEMLPRPLYFLAASQEQTHIKQLWRLDPGAAVVAPVTPAEVSIGAAAIWPEDGRLAYGTETGQLYGVWPGEAPRLLVDVWQSGEEGDADNIPSINGLAWSPDGERLAYSVRSREDRNESKVDGLWLLTLEDGTQMRLLENRYLDPETNDVFDFQVARPVAWSPDGEALLARMGYWEWTDMVWLEPLAPVDDDSNVKDPEGQWVDAAWSLDGRSIWLSGLDRAVVSDLAQAGREQAEVTVLLEGETERLGFFWAQELPEGLAFMAYDETVNEAQLYLGQKTAEGFVYKAAGPSGRLCDQGGLWGLVWDPTGQWAAIRCESTVKLISLDGAVEEDLAPFLGPLSKEEQPAVFWGPEESPSLDRSVRFSHMEE